MAALSPAKAVATQLATALSVALSPETWVLGANIFAGSLRNEGPGVPVRAVFATLDGGAAPIPYLGGSSADSFFQPKVRVRVRSKPDSTDDGYAAGLTLAMACQAALNKPSLEGYMYCHLLQSTPTYLGMDAKGRHEWSLNVELWFSGANLPA